MQSRKFSTYFVLSIRNNYEKPHQEHHLTRSRDILRNLYSCYCLCCLRYNYFDMNNTPTRMFCQICGQLHRIDFVVPDAIWDAAIHPRYKDTHICLNCFMNRADERLIAWDQEIKFMPCSMATQMGIQNSVNELINEVEQLILHAEEGSLDYTVLEHARKLIFRMTHPSEYIKSQGS